MLASIKTVARIAAWTVAALIVFSTLCPLPLRPKTGHPELERFAAYFIAGAAFALAYPKHRRLVSFGLVLAACALEAGQLLIPGRDGRVPDALIKAIAAVVGLTAAALIEHRMAALDGEGADPPETA